MGKYPSQLKLSYGKRVLRPLEKLEPREGEEFEARIERSLRKRLKDLIGALGESDEEELEKYLEEAYQS